MKDITLVLGVHRSGTSVLTAGLKAIGVELGTFPEVRDDDNPKGYFEHADIRDFNDRLLSHLGVSWDNWGFFPMLECLDGPEFAGWRKEAADLLERSFFGPGPYAVKDPRISQLLPFWLAVLDELGWRHRRILILRPPEEVAESQRQRAVRRPGLFPVISHPEAMCALWSVTMYSVLGSLCDDETLLVSHASLYTDTADLLQGCAAFIGSEPNVGAAAQFADEFVNPAFRRVSDPTDDVFGAWAKLARNLHDACGVGDRPRRLSRAEAAAIFRSQEALAAQVAYLPAVRASISRLKTSTQSVTVPDGPQLRDLRKLPAPELAPARRVRP